MYYACIMDKVSFRSQIKFVSTTNFNQKVASFGKENFVALPWSLKESVVSDKAYTKGVSVCSVCVLTDGIKALMMHISPSLDNIKKFSEIEDFIKVAFGNKLDKLKGFLIGAMDGGISLDLNNKFKYFLTNNKIPFSHISKGTGLGCDIAYSVKEDELLISNLFIDDGKSSKKFNSKELVNLYFEECNINELDEMI